MQILLIGLSANDDDDESTESENDPDVLKVANQSEI